MPRGRGQPERGWPRDARAEGLAWRQLEPGAWSLAPPICPGPWGGVLLDSWMHCWVTLTRIPGGAWHGGKHLKAPLPRLRGAFWRRPSARCWTVKLDQSRTDPSLLQVP